MARGLEDMPPTAERRGGRRGGMGSISSLTSANRRPWRRLLLWCLTAASLFGASAFELESTGADAFRSRASLDARFRRDDGNVGLWSVARGSGRRLLLGAQDVELLEATRKGDVEGVKAALAEGADIEARTAAGLTPLIEASLRGFNEVVIVLVNAGADIEARSEIGFTALLVAAQEGHRDVVNELIQAKAELEVHSYNDRVTPLIKSAENGHGIVLLQLLAAGANPNSQDVEGETAIFKVSAYPNTTFLVEHLLDLGADIDHQSNLNNTPLHYAAFFGNQPNAIVLLDRGADSQMVNSNGDKPGDMVCQCLENSGKEGYLACPIGSCGNLTAEKALQDLLGEDSFVEDVNQALLNAAGIGDLDTAKDALLRGANIETRHPNGFTPLLQAAFFGHDKVVHLLLENGADMEARDNLGFTPIQAASQEGHAIVVQVLINWGADPNVQSHDLATPLIKASERGHLAVVQALLDGGAMIDACCTGDGGGPITIAAEGNHLLVVVELVVRGAFLDLTTTEGVTALFKASANLESTSILQVLINHGATVNYRSLTNDTALGYAAFFGNEENVIFLLANGADPLIRNNIGELAKDMVCQCILNQGLEGFLQCPEGACTTDKSRQQIEKILEDQVASIQTSDVSCVNVTSSESSRCVQRISENG